MIGIPKPQRWKSAKYRNAARDQDCTMRLPGCQNDTATVVLAHENGAGMAMKASDLDAADACSFCHDCLDGKQKIAGMTIVETMREARSFYFPRANLATIKNRIERGIIR